MKYHSKLLVSNICHTEIIICIRKFTIVNILGEVLIKFWQSRDSKLRVLAQTTTFTTFVSRQRSR